MGEGLIEACGRARGSAGMGGDKRFRNAVMSGLMVLCLLVVGCRRTPEAPRAIPERWDTPTHQRPLADWIRADSEPESTGKRAPPADYADAIYRAVRRHYAAFQACYQAQLEAIPELYGELVVVFQIDGQGTIEHPVVDFSSLQGPGIEPCVLNVFEGLQVPPPPKEGFTVRYPMVFTSPATPTEIVQVLARRYRLDELSQDRAATRQKDDYEAPW